MRKQVPLPSRKRSTSSTKFSKANPSPNQFQPGQSGNPSGAPKGGRFPLSRPLLERINSRAPDDVCEQMRLPAYSTWGAVWAARLVNEAIKDPSSPASQLLADLLESRPKTAIGIGIGADLFGDSEIGEHRPALHVHFVSSNGNGELSEESRKMIDSLERGEAQPPIMDAQNLLGSET